jgi:hypothetical protein
MGGMKRSGGFHRLKKRVSHAEDAGSAEVNRKKRGSHAKLAKTASKTERKDYLSQRHGDAKEGGHSCPPE